MRIALFALPLALAACSVSTDEQNDAITMQYDENLAENVAADVGNVAAAAANEVAETAGEVKDKVEKTDIDVDVKTDGTDATANAN